MTQEELKRLLSYDAARGLFIWRVASSRNIKIGSVAGSHDVEGYTRIQIRGKGYKTHNLVWLYVHGNFPEHVIDHINGIRDDNRAENLRDVPMAINHQNKPCHRAGKVLGVRRHPGLISKPFEARIRRGGKQQYLGMFATQEEAAAAYHARASEIEKGTP